MAGDTDARAIERHLDNQLQMTHDRFVRAMNGRLPTMTLEQKERYFAVLSPLVEKLELADKPLRQVLQEVVTEAAPLLLQEIGSTR